LQEEEQTARRFRLQHLIIADDFGMDEFQIRELIAANQEVVAQQFQFWMAATFAVVVASYSAGDRLVAWARACIAALYVGAVAVFFLRYVAAIADGASFREMLTDIGASIGAPGLPRWISILRRVVMIGGTVLAVVLILIPKAGHKAAADRNS
jgi:hypothetical protein